MRLETISALSIEIKVEFIRAKNVEVVKELSKLVNSQNNTDIIFHCNLFNLAVRTKTSNVLAG